ncbi:SAYSvFN domain-containing protein 1 [Agrilus planipennis]|uniref:SAYSvFN domain-containing protein 1 n=1 Tax=Agrilus planipennis TaxID=224129 RepID=A0A1W4WUY5_AGRPL|nr:SAYSvFN domain-containing protein 1 [Agrilus planipennis]
MDREKLLSEYRAKKEKEELINEYKERIKRFFITRPKQSFEEPQLQSKASITTKTPYTNRQNDSTSDPDVTESACSESSVLDDCDMEWNQKNITTSIIYYVLWFLLWVTLFAVFIELGFGIIYLIISAIIGMYINTRTDPKRPDEVSAYSVFNKNCESIDGTLKAEHLERDLFFSAGHLK